MDVLHFLKEEYSVLKAQVVGLIPSDMAETLTERSLHAFMARLDLIVRVGGELIIPELVDTSIGSSAATMLAEDQIKSLSRFVAAYKRAGVLLDQKRFEVYKVVSSHLEQMERTILPLVRECIPTAVREDIGIIALDYRTELTSFSMKAPKTGVGSTISA